MDLAPPPVSLRQLQYVLAVAEARSFRRAAERCHVSQPSLSAQVAQLEDALGVRLFERSRRAVLLTAAGEEIVERARRVLLQTGDLCAAAKRFVDPLAGPLRLGVIPTIGPYLLPRIVPGLRRAFPRLVPAWAEDKTEVLVRKVTWGDLDGALLAREADLGILESEAVASDPFLLALPPDHRLARGASPVPARELDGEKVLLLDDGHCFRDQALAVCAKAGAEELGFRATSLPTLAQMVACGAGVTLLPLVAVETECRRSGLVVRDFARPVPARTIVLAWRPGSPTGEALRRLAEVMRSEAGDGRSSAAAPTRGGGRRSRSSGGPADGSRRRRSSRRAPH